MKEHDPQKPQLSKEKKKPVIDKEKLDDIRITYEIRKDVWKRRK